MENQILNFFKENKNKSFSLDILQKTFMVEKEILITYLKGLEQNNLIIFENNEYKLMPNNYIAGIIQSTKKGNHYLNLENGERIYIKAEDLNGALNFDSVIVEICEDNSKKKTGIVKKIIHRKNPNIVCEVKNIKGIKNLTAFNIPINTKFTFDKNLLDKLVDGDRIVVKLSTEKINDCFKADFVSYLCHKDDPDKDIKTIAISKDFVLEFSEEALEEVKKIPTVVSESEIKDRFDLRNKIIFTMDGSHTKDMDDAISLDILPNGNFELGVHIAHVSNYVKYDMAIFKEAFERGTSAYLLDYVIPMIHHLLSNGICSLNEGEDRLTRSCIIEIDKYGKIVDYKIFKSAIHSNKKMTYEDVNQILENNIIPDGYEEYVEVLKKMEELSDILSNKREKKGSLNFLSDEIKVSIDNQGKAIDFNLVNHGRAEKLIENFMIIANEVIASHIYWQNLPFIYRIHECPTENILNNTIDFISDLGYRINTIKDCNNPKVLQSILKNLEDHEDFPILSNLLLRSMKRAVYSTNNIGHFGLASDIYTHFTSPIRRFPDLMVHTLLDEYENMYENNCQNYDRLNELEMFLKEACNHSSYKERQADLAEEEANKFKMMEYMKQYVGQSFEATILMIDNYHVSLKTDNLITGKATIEDIKNDSFIFDVDKCKLIGKHTRQQYKIGNKVSVTVKAVCPEEKEIYFYINENLSIKEKKHVKTLKRH